MLVLVHAGIHFNAILAWLALLAMLILGPAGLAIPDLFLISALLNAVVAAAIDRLIARAGAIDDDDAAFDARRLRPVIRLCRIGGESGNSGHVLDIGHRISTFCMISVMVPASSGATCCVRAILAGNPGA